MRNLSVLSFTLIIGITMFLTHTVDGVLGGCENNESCTDLCGYAGAGECVEGKYCKCATCPQRSPSELTYMPKVCTLEPSCQLKCPGSTLSLMKGKLYTGHQCIHGTSLVCICFCMPTTPQSVIEVLKCPFPKKNDTDATTTTTAA